MSDTYQATYDAVRSRFHGCDAGNIIESAAREAFGSAERHIEGVAFEYKSAAYEQQRPAVLFRPALYPDGNQWCALYGSDLQSGVAGFGDSPAQAMADFDKRWAASPVSHHPR